MWADGRLWAFPSKRLPDPRYFGGNASASLLDLDIHRMDVEQSLDLDGASLDVVPIERSDIAMTYDQSRLATDVGLKRNILDENAPQHPWLNLTSTMFHPPRDGTRMSTWAYKSPEATAASYIGR